MQYNSLKFNCHLEDIICAQYPKYVFEQTSIDIINSIWDHQCIQFMIKEDLYVSFKDEVKSEP